MIPAWLYDQSPFAFATHVVLTTVSLAIAGLLLTRRYVLPHIKHFNDGVNDAISGAVQAIGIFYGVTVGLIAIGVWDNYSKAADITSREAATAFALYINVNKFPEPPCIELGKHVSSYIRSIIRAAWPRQKAGRTDLSERREEWRDLSKFHTALAGFEPISARDKIRYESAMDLYNRLIEQRRLRNDIAEGGLSDTMWALIFIGATISISIAYFFHIKDAWLHGTLILLMSGFLGIVLFMIALNDKPFLGYASLKPKPFEEVLTIIESMWPCRAANE